MTTRANWLNLPGLAACAFALAAWEAAVRSGAITFDFLPAPSAITAAFWRLSLSGQIALETAHTLFAVFIGWAVACAIGIALGLCLGLSRQARTYSLATVEILRPMPGIAFLPLALLLFNFSLQTELIVIIYPSIWPILTNTMSGVTNVGLRLSDVGRTLHLSRMRTITKVLIPAAAPAILVGCRLSLGTALVMAIIAEMIGNPHGLGFAVVREMQAFQPENMFGYVVFIGVLGVVLNAGLIAVTEHLWPGHFRRADAHG